MSSDDKLVAFLKARISEDEALAREGADGGSGEWFMGDKWNVYRADDEARYDEDYRGAEHRLVIYGNIKPQSQHIARHDPARVLRDVTAKRAILALYDCATAELRGSPDDPKVIGWARAAEVAASDLAAIYSDHPDYRPHFASGGVIHGYGTSGGDSVPAILSRDCCVPPAQSPS